MKRRMRNQLLYSLFLLIGVAFPAAQGQQLQETAHRIFELTNQDRSLCSRAAAAALERPAGRRCPGPCRVDGTRGRDLPSFSG